MTTTKNLATVPSVDLSNQANLLAEVNGEIVRLPYGLIDEKLVLKTEFSEYKISNDAELAKQKSDLNDLGNEVADLPNNETLIENVAEVVKNEVPLVKSAEQPDFVNSIDEMVDTSKVYVMPDGYLYGYREIKNYNLFKISDASFSSRLQDNVEGSVSSTSGNAVTGWIPVVHGQYYSFTVLADGYRCNHFSKGTFPVIVRMNLKKDDGTVIVYNSGSSESTGIQKEAYDNGAFGIPEGVVAIRIHFNTGNYDGTAASSAQTFAVYEPMIIEGKTASEAYTKSTTYEYVDGGAETITEWYNTGLVYNQPVNYEERVVKLEKDITELQEEVNELEESMINPASASPYYREVNWGCVPNDYFRGKCDSYSTEGFTNYTTYAEYISKFKELIVGHDAYATETHLGDASDGQPIYMYDFKPVRWDNELINIPKIIIVAGQHGSEKCNIFGLYYLVKDLLNNWFGSPALEYLRHHVELMIVPVVNTYGFTNCDPTNTGEYGYKNANGVNINRNYSSGWTSSGDYGDPTSPQYSGSEPFDQPETQIVRDLVLNNADCVLLIDSHTNSLTNTESWEKMGYYGISDVKDAYFNRARNALPELVSKISPNFNVDYNLNAPNTRFGFLTIGGGNGILRRWGSDNNIVTVLIEGFAGFLDGEPVSADVFKANEEQMVNWLITAMNYLSK